MDESRHTDREFMSLRKRHNKERKATLQVRQPASGQVPRASPGRALTLECAHIAIRRPIYALVASLVRTMQMNLRP